MKTLDLIQGSELWHQARLQHFTASEAPQMMGASKYGSRDALLKLKATGIAPEINEATQRLFNKGHATEAAIRPCIEALLQEELYPITGSLEIEGLKLLASFDGLTMTEEKGFEHKLWNESLAGRVQARDLEPHYYWQLEQQLLVSGAESICFVVSDGTPDKCVWMSYEPVAGRREELIAGWKQFAIDLANYVLPEAEAPKAIAEPVATLPAITYQTKTGNKGLELASNLEIYKEAAQKLVEQSKKKLETDQDFANAESRIKACKDAEERIAVIQSNVICEVADIDKFVKDLGAISEMLRQCRLNEDKQVKDRKEKIRLEIITESMGLWNTHLNLINETLKPIKLPAVSIDFVQAIKGKKTVASLRSAANDELARAKIEADRVFTIVSANLEMLREIAGDYRFLFADTQSICAYEKESLRAIAIQRINEHKANVAEAARIENERLAKLKADEDERIANEQIEKDRQAELAKAQAAAVEAVKPLEVEVKPVREQQLDLAESIPADYEQYAAQAPQFEQSFNQVFNDDNVEPMVDLSDYQKGFNAGRIAGLDLALAIFIKHGSSGFAKAVEDFIEVGAPEAQSKAA